MVEFPRLGLQFNVDRVAFKVFEIEIYWYGIIIALGFLIAILLALRHSKKYDIEQDSILDIILYSIISAIIMARVFYVVFSWDDFKDNVLEVFNIRKGGLAVYGGIIGAITTAYIYTRIKKIPFLKMADFCMPYVPLGQAIGRWGNFVNQEAYGTHTTLPWGMDGTEIQNGPVHPTFLYESLWNLMAFFVLIYLRKKKKVEGEVFFLYMILYGIGRAWIEPLRTDSLMLGNLRINFLVALLFAVIFSIVFIYRRIKLKEAQPVVGEESSRYRHILDQLKEEEGNLAGEGAEEKEVIEEATGELTEEATEEAIEEVAEEATEEAKKEKDGVEKSEEKSNEEVYEGD